MTDITFILHSWSLACGSKNHKMIHVGRDPFSPKMSLSWLLGSAMLCGGAISLAASQRLSAHRGCSADPSDCQHPCTATHTHFWTAEKSRKPAWNHLFQNTYKADVMVLLHAVWPPFSSLLAVFIPTAIQFCHRNSPAVCAFDLLSLMLICELKFS